MNKYVSTKQLAFLLLGAEEIGKPYNGITRYNKRGKTLQIEAVTKPINCYRLEKSGNTLRFIGTSLEKAVLSNEEVTNLL